MAGYSYREEILTLGHRVIGELLPPGAILRSDAQVDGEQSVRIRKRSDGHFIVKTQANGVPLSMLVDTGASTVVLKPADAQKLGIDPERLRYSVPVQTANGTTYAAHVRLRTLTLGPDQSHRRRRSGGQARRAEGEPARYEFLKQAALI